MSAEADLYISIIAINAETNAQEALKVKVATWSLLVTIALFGTFRARF